MLILWNYIIKGESPIMSAKSAMSEDDRGCLARIDSAPVWRFSVLPPGKTEKVTHGA